MLLIKQLEKQELGWAHLHLNQLKEVNTKVNWKLDWKLLRFKWHHIAEEIPRTRTSLFDSFGATCAMILQIMLEDATFAKNTGKWKVLYLLNIYRFGASYQMKLLKKFLYCLWNIPTHQWALIWICHALAPDSTISFGKI